MRCDQYTRGDASQTTVTLAIYGRCSSITQLRTKSTRYTLFCTDYIYTWGMGRPGRAAGDVRHTLSGGDAAPPSALLSSEKGGIRQSNVYPSSLSILNVPLQKQFHDICNNFKWYFTYHICPLGACKLTWLLYWKAGSVRVSAGSWPTTPRPLTVSKVPDNENIRQCRSLSWTASAPRFSNLMQYLH